MTTQDPHFRSMLEPTLQEGFRLFKSCIRFYSAFHIAFVSFLCLQLIAFLLFFSYFSQSLAAACGVALFFLTLFSYFVLLFFFQSKKPQQFRSIRSHVSNLSISLFSFEEKSSESLLALSRSLEEFALFLQEQEPFFYASSTPFKPLSPLIHKFNIWLHWKNFHKMKELVLTESAKLLISLIRLLPTDLEPHANLAETYTKLSLLYIHPKKICPSCPFPWISPEYESSSMKNSFLFYSEKAIEEFNILSELSPKDPWVLAHLAEIYRLQEKADEEISLCEQLLEMSPDNEDLLFQLGVLYFQEGHPAKGLKTYKQLQQTSSTKANLLIQYYN